MAEKYSIGNSSRKIAHLMHYILFITVLCIILLVFSRISITVMEKSSSTILQKINTLALALRDSTDTPSKALLKEYSEYEALLEELEDGLFSPGRLLVTSEKLPFPAFSGEKEHQAYREELVSYAGYLRTLNNRIMRGIFLVIYILLGIVFLFVLGMYILFRLFGRSVDHSIDVMLKGMDIIDTRLNYESADFFSLPPKAPEEVKRLNEMVNRIDRDILLDQYIDNIEGYGGIPEILENLAPVIYKIIPFDRIALAVNDQAGRVTAESAFTKYQGVFLEPGHSEYLYQSTLPQLIERGEGRIINDLPGYAHKKKVSESTMLILREGIQSSLTIPLVQNRRCIGFLFFSSLEKNVYKPVHIKIAQRIGNRIKSKLYHEYMAQELIAESANAMVGLMDEKDNETSEHLSRMSRYASIIARKLSRRDFSVSPGFPRELLWFAPLHDIGKIAVPDSILLKPGVLTDGEYAQMKSHVNVGLKIIRSMNKRMVNILNQPILKTAEDIILGHHEKYNGTGYPNGLKGREIPLAGRIVAIADVFDALTSKRPYKEAFSVEKALDIMENEMTGSFDPYLFEVFVESLDEIRVVMDTYRE